MQIMSGTVSLQLINTLYKHEVSKLHTVKSMPGSNMESSDRESNFGYKHIYFNNYVTATEVY